MVPILVSLLYLFIAVTAFWGLLRWLDYLGQIKFKVHVMPQLKNDPKAAAIYFGLRILAVAIIISAVL